ncbi:MAG: DUF4293 domain-containing protein [Muribaculum sp.]|nr:DUF4293 domain-containing protein [Muribaculaceae bacterium]MCM1080850.1 DUF4293 domain-containing protein [Muribaculum sp.]
MLLICILPIGYTVNVTDANSLTAVHASDILPLLIIGIVAALTFLLSIFLFKNLDLQKSTVVAACILSVAVIVISAITSLWLSLTFASLALISGIWAYKRISADQNLLRSYDRLR